MEHRTLEVDFDFASIEARLISHYEHGEDPYVEEASRRFGVPTEQVTAQMRSFTKLDYLRELYGVSGTTTGRYMGIAGSNSNGAS